MLRNEIARSDRFARLVDEFEIQDRVAGRRVRDGLVVEAEFGLAARTGLKEIAPAAPDEEQTCNGREEGGSHGHDCTPRSLPPPSSAERLRSPSAAGTERKTLAAS